MVCYLLPLLKPPPFVQLHYAVIILGDCSAISVSVILFFFTAYCLQQVGFMLLALIWKFDFPPFMVLIIAILNDGKFFLLPHWSIVSSFHTCRLDWSSYTSLIFWTSYKIELKNTYWQAQMLSYNISLQGTLNSVKLQSHLAFLSANISVIHIFKIQVSMWVVHNQWHKVFGVCF